MLYSRDYLATIIIERLESEKEAIVQHYQDSMRTIGHFAIDNLLPEDIAKTIYQKFPKVQQTHLKKSLREFKHVAAQMDNYDKQLEEAIFAFQDKRIINFFKELSGIESLSPDASLYAGGISMMGEAHFLNPHIDNSHDKDRELWRVFNLLFYVTPDWKESNGGNLELWPNGIDKEPLTIHSKFNRLVVMATHNGSWHSVSKVEVDAIRCCVSNYYFSENPLLVSDSFHVTSFRGRPEQKVRNVILKVDASLRMGIRELFKKGIKENPHVYKKPKS